jgi:hypothetical protein
MAKGPCFKCRAPTLHGPRRRATPDLRRTCKLPRMRFASAAMHTRLALACMRLPNRKTLMLRPKPRCGSQQGRRHGFRHHASRRRLPDGPGRRYRRVHRGRARRRQSPVTCRRWPAAAAAGHLHDVHCPAPSPSAECSFSVDVPQHAARHSARCTDQHLSTPHRRPHLQHNGPAHAQ